MQKVSLNVYIKLLQAALLHEENPDVLFRKLLCTLAHLSIVMENLGMANVNDKLEEIYQLAAKYQEIDPNHIDKIN